MKVSIASGIISSVVAYCLISLFINSASGIQDAPLKSNIVSYEMSIDKASHGDGFIYSNSNNGIDLHTVIQVAVGDKVNDDITTRYFVHVYMDPGIVCCAPKEKLNTFVPKSENLLAQMEGAPIPNQKGLNRTDQRLILPMPQGTYMVGYGVERRSKDDDEVYRQKYINFVRVKVQ